MDPKERFQRIAALFEHAVQLPADDLVAFLNRECGGDEPLREELWKLLRAHAAASTGLGGDAAGLGLDLTGEGTLDFDTSAPDSLSSRLTDYKLHEVVGEGGMGSVYRATQEKPVRRTVAIKLIKLGMDSRHILARFEAERQALALMEHPSIAKVYDGGVSQEGRPFFVMEFVSGVPITEYCDQKKLSTRDRLELFVDVCRAVQHAHQKGIIHRDLKPSNILVTTDGDRPLPKVIDFGVAKATGQELTERTLFTETGAIIGTPEYMSPEQAESSVEGIDTRTDVYSLGVVLYELLVGRLPFDSQTLRKAGYDEIRRIIREETPAKPSTRVSELARGSTRETRSTDSGRLTREIRGDLDWITLKALEKDRERRYSSASEFAADLQRYFRNEPVVACPPSVSYRLKKFARKNRAVVVGSAAVAAALILGIVGIYLQYRETDEARQSASSRLEQITRLADLKRLRDADEGAAEFWPALPDRADAMEKWLKDHGYPLRDRLPGHKKVLAQLREDALPYGEAEAAFDRETHPKAPLLGTKRGELDQAKRRAKELEADGRLDYRDNYLELVERLLDEIAELEVEVKQRHTYEFDDVTVTWQHDLLSELVDQVAEFTSDDPHVGTIASVEQRLAFARGVEERTLTGVRAKAAWARALDQIRESDNYGPIAKTLEPRMGLYPLGADPHSGLQEFLHLQTHAGEIPKRTGEGTIPITEELGIILVFISDATFVMGSQQKEKDGLNYTIFAERDEGPPHEIPLDPFFIAKYEVTQSQWIRMTGDNPSIFKEGLPFDYLIDINLNPVEQVSRTGSAEVLQRYGLQLPTEAQWECAARGGTSTPWWTGAVAETIGTKKGGNVFDAKTGKRWQSPDIQTASWEDPYFIHGPIGKFAPNPFGLYDVIGNVSEWCRDQFATYNVPAEPRTGLRRAPGTPVFILRGGAHYDQPKHSRSGTRRKQAADFIEHSIGVRPSIDFRE